MHLPTLKLNLTRLERKKRIVAPDAYVKAGMKLGSALADDNRAGGNGLPAISLHTTVLRIGVATVP